MKQKILLTLAVSVALSMSSVMASEISGFTQTSGTFNIDPSFIGGDVGYRQYDNFNLTAGDIANLRMYGTKNGADRDLGTFINLVKNQTNINGILNTIGRDGNFSNGHAVFITPGGMVVGASGVLNVGRLSVVTPTMSKYNSLVSDLENKNVTNINQISKLKQDSNAAIEINGKIFANNGVDLRGSSVNVSGNIINGVANQTVLTSTAAADTLFNSLVNTNGTIKAGTTAVNNGSVVLIKADDKNDGGSINISGKVVNNDNGGTFITNKADNGTTISGAVTDRANQVRIYNQNGALTLSSDSNISAPTVDIINTGSGKLSAAGNITYAGNLKIRNENGNGLDVASTATGSGQVAIRNKVGALNYTGNITNTSGNSQIINYGTSGMTLNGTLNNSGTGNIDVYNKAGAFNVGSSANVKANNGYIYMGNTTNGTGLTVANGAQVVSNNGNIAIRNESGSDGFTLNGKVETKNGELSINNDLGSLALNTADIDAKGNLGIVNRSTTGTMTIGTGTDINVTGNANIKQDATSGNMYVNGKITHTGRVNVIDNATGTMNLGATVVNNSGALGTNGGFYAVTRENASKMNVTNAFNHSGAGEILIKNVSGSDGFDYNGTITANGYQAALVNRKGAYNVGGSITTTNNGQVIVRQGIEADPANGAMNLTGTINSSAKGWLINWGPSNMTTTGASITNMEKRESITK